MALESGTYINSLNASNPASTDGLGQADDHLRLIKSTLKATFPNITGQVTATQNDLNGIGSIPSDLTDLGISDGTSGQFLTTDGGGNFSFASVSQSSGGIALTDLSIGSELSASGNGGISYDNTSGVFQYTPPTASGIGALTAHPATSPQAAGSVNNNGSTFIQDITVDSFGHITAITSATAGGSSGTFSSSGTFANTRIENLGSSTENLMYFGYMNNPQNKTAAWSTSSSSSGAFFVSERGNLMYQGSPASGNTTLSDNSATNYFVTLYLPAGVTLGVTAGTNQSPLMTGAYVTVA